MRVPCPKCQTTLELAAAPPPGVKIQCGQCGAQFGVQVQRPTASPVRPVVLPRSPGGASHPAPTPVAVTEIPEADVHDTEIAGDTSADTGLEPRKKKKKKKFRKSARSSNVGLKLGIAGGITLVAFAVVFFILYQSGIFRTRSVVEFNDEMVAILVKLDKTGEGMMMQPGVRNNPAQALQGLEKLGSEVATALAAVKRIPPPDEGKPFHDATIKLLERLDKFLRTDMKQAMSMVTAGRQNEAMQMMMSTMSELQQLQANVVTTQNELAKKHGFNPLVNIFGKQR